MSFREPIAAAGMGREGAGGAVGRAAAPARHRHRHLPNRGAGCDRCSIHQRSSAKHEQQLQAISHSIEQEWSGGGLVHGRGEAPVHTGGEKAAAQQRARGELAGRASDGSAV